MDTVKKDEALKGNEKIEEYIALLQKEPSQEMLAVTLTAIRRRMQENGQWIVALDPAMGELFQVQTLKTEDGKNWIMAFTGFEEELKGGNEVMSTFMADIGQLLTMAWKEPSVEGLILNPWNRTLMLDKTLISLILGKQS